MKDLIRRIIKEEVSNRRQEKLIHFIKSLDIHKASKVVGGIDNLFKVLDINSPMDFLHLFDDLDVVQSEEDPNLTLFRYKPKNNLIIYNRKNDVVYINYYEIWLVLQSHFALNYTEIQRFTKKWLNEVYNLKGVTTVLSPPTTPTGWMRSTI